MYADTVKQFAIEHGLTESEGVNFSAEITHQLVDHLNDLGIETHGSKDMEEDLRRRKEAKETEIELTFDRQGFHGQFLDGLEYIGDGSESTVYKKGNKAIKIGEPYYSDSLESRVSHQLAIDKLNNLNTRLIGFYYSYDSKGNKFKNPIFEQDFIDGREATKKEIDDHLKKLGFEEVEGSSVPTFTNERFGISISDVYSGNAFVKDGEVVFIDADIELIATNNLSTENDDIRYFINPYSLPDGEFTKLESILLTQYGNSEDYGAVVHTVDYEYTVNYKGGGEFDIIEFHRINRTIHEQYDRKRGQISDALIQLSGGDELAEGEYNSDSYDASDGEANGRNVGLDKETSQGKSKQTESDAGSQKHKGWRAVKRDSATGRITFADEGSFESTAEDWERESDQQFITPQGQIYGYAAPEGAIYLDERVIKKIPNLRSGFFYQSMSSWTTRLSIMKS